MNPQFFSLSMLLAASMMNVRDERARRDMADLVVRIAHEENQ